MIRKVLIALGRNNVSASPKPLFRDALEENIIIDIKNWFAFLEARNSVAYIYDEKEAERVYNIVKEFPNYAEKLLENLAIIK